MSRTSNSEIFNKAAVKRPAKASTKRLRKPFSLGLYDDERAQIERDAGTLPLGVYIRRELLGDTDNRQGSKHNPRRVKRPSIDHELIAQLMGMMGQSEHVRAVLAYSIAAQSGALPVTPELEQELTDACNHIHDMRRILIAALNLKVEDGR